MNPITPAEERSILRLLNADDARGRRLRVILAKPWTEAGMRRLAEDVLSLPATRGEGELERWDGGW